MTLGVQPHAFPWGGLEKHLHRQQISVCRGASKTQKSDRTHHRYGTWKPAHASFPGASARLPGLAKDLRNFLGATVFKVIASRCIKQRASCIQDAHFRGDLPPMKKFAILVALLGVFGLSVFAQDTTKAPGAANPPATSGSKATTTKKHHKKHHKNTKKSKPAKASASSPAAGSSAPAAK